jgi:hypothetical protein
VASTLALPAIRTAILVALRASVALTTYVGLRIYPDSDGDAPSKPSYPYVQLESGSETPLNTFGEPSALKYGSEARLQIRVGSQTRSDVQADSITSVIKGVLDGQPLVVTGYASVTCEFESLAPLRDYAGGIVTREWISTYLVTVHQ